MSRWKVTALFSVVVLTSTLLFLASGSRGNATEKDKVAAGSNLLNYALGFRVRFQGGR